MFQLHGKKEFLVSFLTISIPKTDGANRLQCLFRTDKEFAPQSSKTM